MSDIAIRVENLSKRYRIGEFEPYGNLRESLSRAATAPFRWLSRHTNGNGRPKAGDADREIWALKDVTFEVKRGEVLGVIGRNGAGKSTLLKILSRITEPTEGTVDLFGRVGSLLEVGTGFHPELTGRENIFLNGAILGMSRAEINRKFDDIVEFAGVEKFIDTPVKRYSSGMGVRLGFAVAAHLEPEILIVDEVLAVGDAEFQKRCLGKMDDVAKEGRTVLFVSHNMAAVENLCTRAILVVRGRTRFDGGTALGISTYLEANTLNLSGQSLQHVPREAGHSAVIVRIDVLDELGRPTFKVSTGDPATFRVHYDNGSALTDASFSLSIESTVGTPVSCLHTRQQFGPISSIPPSGIISCHVPRLPLAPGMYYITVGCGSHRRRIDLIPRIVRIEVLESDLFGTGYILDQRHGSVLVDAEWSLP